MQEIPLISIFNFAAGLICTVSAVQMYFVTKKIPENIRIRYFFYSFIFIAVYFFASGLPMLAVKDPFSITALSSLFSPFLLIGGMFLCLIPLNLKRFKILENLYMWLIFLIVLSGSVLNFLGLREIAGISFYRNIEYWIRPENDLITYGTIILGLSFIISLLLASVFYFNYAIKKKKNKTAFSKAMMIGIGCFLFSLGAFCNYVIGLSPENFILMNHVGSLLFMTGTVAFNSSVFYKEKSIN